MNQLESNVKDRIFRRGEIYYIDLSDLDFVDSHVQGKSRPGLLIQNDIGNEASDNVIVALITSAAKKPYPFQYKMSLNGRSSTIMFDQILTISKNRIKDKVGELTPQQIIEADNALMCSLNLIRYSITNINSFNVKNVVMVRTQNGDKTYCTFDILSNSGPKQFSLQIYVSVDDLTKYDSSITINSDLEKIKTVFDNVRGINYLMNHTLDI